MADTKGANISRMVLKQAGRAKEKVGSSKAHSERGKSEEALLSIM